LRQAFSNSLQELWVGMMMRKRSTWNALICAVVLPLFLAGCGSKPPKPCRQSTHEMAGKNMAEAEKKAERYIRNETKRLKKKHKDKLTLKPAETKCEEGAEMPADAAQLSKKELKKAKKAAKPKCKVVLPYCVKIEGLTPPADAAKKKDEETAG
jgi:outer membrane PBP1 activator LpoA protein